MIWEQVWPGIHKGRPGGILGNRSTSVNQYYKSEKNWKRDMKSLKKQNKIIFRMTKWSGSRHELNKIKNINARS